MIIDTIQPQIESFIASLPEGTVVQLSTMRLERLGGRHALAIVISEDSITTQAGIELIEEGHVAQRQTFLDQFMDKAKGQMGI